MNVKQAPSAGAQKAPSCRPPVIRLEAAPSSPKKLRVAGYCRVSTDMTAQESSLKVQRLHCEKLILSHPDWVLVDIYWEQGVSATGSDFRPELGRLLADCEAGRIDLVLTKSISRFSRNTSDCLSMVRRLDGLGVRIIFEKENIDTASMESELLLTLLTAFSESESRSLSGNMKWGIRRRFALGTYRAGRLPYGYRREGERVSISPGEARTVERIFLSVLSGQGCQSIAAELNRDGVPTWSRLRFGADREEPSLWSASSVRGILRNPFYTGDCLWQKTFMDDTYHQRANRGELNMYLWEDDHPAIISREIFSLAGQMLERRTREKGSPQTRGSRSCFSGRLLCGLCGGKMYRAAGTRPTYICTRHRKKSCPMMPQGEADLQNAFATQLNKLAWGEKHGVPVLGEYFLAGKSCPGRQPKTPAPHEPSLREAVLKRGIQTRFTLPGDADLFSSHVEKALVWAGERAEFHFTCGLVLSEGLSAPVRK